MYVIVREGRVLWRGNVRSTCIRLAPFFRGIASVEMFGSIVPLACVANALALAFPEEAS